VQLVKKTSRTSASGFLEALIAAVPYKIHTVLTGNGIQFTLSGTVRARNRLYVRVLLYNIGERLRVN
jgi:hypothetical protein